MSHFVGIVLIPKSTTKEAVDDVLSKLLAPYDEGMDVPEYKRECYCVSMGVTSQVRKEVEEKFGSIDKQRELFHAKVQNDPELKAKNEADPFDEDVTAKWQEFIKPITDFEEKRREELKPTAKPDPECESCKGTGEDSTTYNPKSKWDWYSIGGRWTGYLTDYEPSKDPANIETCSLCKGTGTRSDMPIWEGDPFKGGKVVATKSDTCNGCNGTGEAVKWPTQWKQYKGDIVEANFWLHKLDQDPKKYSPYSVVTPDGEWHQRGEMGWFGMSSGDKDKNVWADEVRRLAEAYANDCKAVVVDFHI